jgi:hypothetical protein
MDKKQAVSFLRNMQTYFVVLQSEIAKEDKAFWAYGQSAANCGIIANKIENGDFK